MCSNRVEVTQQDCIDGRSADDIVVNDFLTNLFGIAIRAFGLLDGGIFSNGQVLGVGLSVNGARRGEDDTFHAILRHEFQKVHQRVQIVAIIEQRLFNTFANSFRCGKVDDALNA